MAPKKVEPDRTSQSESGVGGRGRGRKGFRMGPEHIGGEGVWGRGTCLGLCGGGVCVWVWWEVRGGVRQGCVCARVCMCVSVHVCARVCTRGVHTWCVACTPPTCWGPTAGCCPCFGGQFLHQSADVASEVDSGLGPAKRGHLWRGRSSVLHVLLVSYHRGAAAFAHKPETPRAVLPAPRHWRDTAQLTAHPVKALCPNEPNNLFIAS